MLIYGTDHFVLPLPPAHRFPMHKYAMLRAQVTAAAPHCMRVPNAATRRSGVNIGRPKAALPLPVSIERRARTAGFWGHGGWRSNEVVGAIRS